MERDGEGWRGMERVEEGEGGKREGRGREGGGKGEGRGREGGGRGEGRGGEEGGKREGRGREEGGKREGRGREEGEKREGRGSTCFSDAKPRIKIPTAPARCTSCVKYAPYAYESK